MRAINRKNALLILFTIAATISDLQHKTIRFDGPITIATGDKLRIALSDSRTEILEISSTGGNEEIALDLSEIIKERGIKVVVNGVCLSACAQYLLLSSRNAEVKMHSVVGYHQSALAINAWSRQFASNDTVYAEISAKSEMIASRTTAIFPSDRHAKLLRSVFAQTEPLCISRPNAQSDGQWRILMRNAFVMPSANLMHSFGVKMPINWPQNEIDMKTYLAPFGRLPDIFTFQGSIGDQFRSKLLLCR